MLNIAPIHNLYKESYEAFEQYDPQLKALSSLTFQHTPTWWQTLTLDIPGVYIVTGGRQIGKSTSCKQLIKHCLRQKYFSPEQILYLPCDEVFDAKALSQLIRQFLETVVGRRFLLIVDEVTYVPQWDRVVKALADEGHFQQGLCLLTGSDTTILKEAAMRFPGRRGSAGVTDFHLYPLSFREYVQLVQPGAEADPQALAELLQGYLQCGGYLRAINDLAQYGEVSEATFATYEQWVRGDFLKRGKNEHHLANTLRALIMNSISQISYTTLTQNIGEISKETCIQYCNLLESMDVLFHLQAYDQNKNQGSPKKARKFHFFDPFIYHTLHKWLQKEHGLNTCIPEAHLVEAVVASHCYRQGKTFYFKGQGEVDVLTFQQGKLSAFEVKWANQVRLKDLQMLKHFHNSKLLTKTLASGSIEGVPTQPVCEFLMGL